MDPLIAVVLSCSTCVFGALLGYAGVRLVDRFRLKGVRFQAEEIVRAAREEADTIKKEAELKARDDLYQQREACNRETEQVRGELREQERRLDKREDSLEEKNQSLQKKERSLDNLKTKLSDRRAELERQGKEVETLIRQQTAKLHEMSGFTARAGRACLDGAAGARAVRGDRRPAAQARGSVAAGQRGKSPPHPGDGHPPLRRRAHRRHHRQHGGHPQRRHEGADHRPGRAKHPHLREVYRRGRDRG